MAGVTEHYGLAVGLVTDDFIEPEHHNRVAATVDRVVGGFLKKMMADGAYSGWGLTLEGTVTAGEGLVGGCWCATNSEQVITGLAAGTNYVFGRAESEGPTTGAVAFFAQLSATKAPGTVLLGTAEMNGFGVVTAVEEGLEGADRNCVRLEIGTVRGSGLVADVGASEEFTVEVTHTQGLLVPGAIEFAGSEGFSWELRETYRGEGFVVQGRNEGAVEADFSYSWVRRGLLG